MPLRSVLEELAEFDTALLANTISQIDPTSAHCCYMGSSIRSVTPSLGPSVGIAVTCELDSSSPGGQAETDLYWRQLDEISKARSPVIWVVKTVGSRPDHECVLGDGMAKTLFAAGCVAVVTDGGVRDINGLLSIPFAAYSKGTTIHHEALRFRRINGPVEIGGITIAPGDVIHAQTEGVIRIPSSCLETLVPKAIQMRAFEHEAQSMLRRSDLSTGQKRQRISDLLIKHGFSR
ncbi:MAG: RraA family protein [Acidobacteriota bacterium]